MTYGERFHRLFPDDLAESTAYYDRISIDLGNRFRDRVREKLQPIIERPESYGLIRQPLRGAMIEGFPYLLLFRILDSDVYLAGLYHASSDPSRWFERIDRDG